MAHRIWGAVGVLLLVLTLQTLLFLPFGYRGDEAWRLHFGYERPPTEIVFQVAVQGRETPPAGWLAVTLMRYLGGPSEAGMRHQVALLATVVLAIVYRQIFELFGHRQAIWSVITVGCSVPMIYYLRDAGPYILVMLTGLGTTYCLFRRIVSPNIPGFSFLYVLLGIIGVYSHYFMVFLIIGHAIYVLVFIRLGVRLFGLFAAVGVAFTLGWGVPVFSLLLDSLSGESFAVSSSTVSGNNLTNGYFLSPPRWFALPTIAFGTIILVAVFLLDRQRLPQPTATRSSTFRVTGGWRYTYLWGGAYFAFLVMMIVHLVLPIYTPRNALIAFPQLAATLTVMIVSYPWQRIRPTIRRFVFGLIGLLFLIQWVYIPTFDYRPVKFTHHINRSLTADDHFIIHSDEGYYHLLFNFYVQEVLSKSIPHDQILMVQDRNNILNEEILTPPDMQLNTDSLTSQQQAQTWLTGVQRLWYIEYQGIADLTYLNRENLIPDTFCLLREQQSWRWMILAEYQRCE